MSVGHGGNPVLTANMLDEEGKAFFGVPGPGMYRPATSFHATGIHSPAQTLRRTGGVSIPREYIEQELADAGRHAYPSAPAYSLKGKAAGRQYISSEHARGDAGYDSPGPKYAPTTRDLPGSPRYTMAGRSGAGALAIAEGPGPKYRFYEGLGHVGTMGDGAHMSFGTGKNHDDLHHKHMEKVPGPGQYDHELPSFLPKYSFAGADPEHERTRDKLVQAAKVFISGDHAMRDFAGLDTPGPGTYAPPKQGVETRFRKPFTHTFNREARSPKRAPYMGQEYMGPDEASPGPAYNVSGPLRAPGSKFGSEPRLFSPEHGGNMAGPIISKLHSAIQVGAESPGPCTYDSGPLKGPSGSKFGSSGRHGTGSFLNLANHGPGPGAYYPKKLDGKHPINPAFYMGVRTKHGGIFDFNSIAPGPGAYTGGEAGSPRTRPQSPKREAVGTFGYAKDRATFIPQIDSPGPAHYFEGAFTGSGEGGEGEEGAEGGETGLMSTMQRTGASMASATSRGQSPTKSGYTFGVSAPRPGTMFISRLHAASESYGRHSPGPGTYDGEGNAAAARKSLQHKFTKSKRRTIIEEVAESAVDASPGPAAYRAFTQLNRPAGKAGTFGTSVRPSLAKVTY